MSEESLREEISNWLEIRMRSPELLDHIKSSISKKPDLKPVIGEKGVVKIRDLLEIKHPILRKLADPGNMSRVISGETSRLIEEILDLIDSEDLEALRRLESLSEEFLRRLRDISIDFILKKTLEAENDLRPTMIPGSVGRDEVPNLYMPTESYGRDDRVRLALQLSRSVAVGDSVSIYFDGPFHGYLRQRIRGRFSRPYLEHGDIGASRWEMEEPFVALLRILLWIYGEIAGEKNRDEVIEMMKSSSGVIYFVPADGERRTAFFFPQLSVFVDAWLLREDRRKALEDMLNSIKLASSSVSKKKSDAASKQIELIYHYLNLLAISLLERASIPWEPLRRIVDIILDLAYRYDAPASLHFIMLLDEADERAPP